MGPRSALAVTAATAALFLCPVSPAAAVQEPPPGRAFAPRCGDPGAGRFPVRTALHGDGAALRAGGARGELTLRLHNTSAGACRDVHPVAVVSHETGGRLRPADIRLEFHDGQARRWRSVAFERTGADESAGVFAGGSRGFVLRAGESREVRLRVGFAEGAPPGRVTVNVTTVQRRGDDGEWVGQSKDYETGIERGRRCCGETGEPEEATERPAEPREGATPERPRRRPEQPGARESGGPERRGPRAESGPPEAPGTRGAPGTGAPGSPAAPGAPATPGAPGTPPRAGAPDVPPTLGPPGTPTAPPAPQGTPVPQWPNDAPPAPPRLPGAAPMPESLAATGGAATAAAAAATGTLLLGTALLLTTHRRRRTPRNPPDSPHP
ncbi:hypothetical protein OG946_11775 [Streptomyces sp. NBC_01808]|uniref:hypothetical protein n=1 Tax=Streptomyces sp. NBC_01808 TaxID=2975947 RepID=UPI002DDA255D|nr:hypothetical protein [Streptomyces sp. NBC_01808]WSA37996.1 hypothetical protein OG946_11775 [Streptomyces sp. NBC_01808]